MWIAYAGKIWFRDPVQVENRHKEILQIGVQRDACVVNTGQKLVPQAISGARLAPGSCVVWIVLLNGFLGFKNLKIYLERNELPRDNMR